MQHFLVKRQGVFPGRFLFYFQGQKKSRDFRQQHGDLLRSTIRQSVFDLVDHGLGDHNHRAAEFLLGAVVGKVDGLLFSRFRLARN